MNMHITSFGRRTPAVPSAKPAADHAGTWHQNAAPTGIAAAITDLSAIAIRLAVIHANNPQLHDIREAEFLTGRLVDERAFKFAARGVETHVRPSNGGSALSALWDMLGQMRDQAIRDQLMAENLPFYTDAGLTQEQSDEAFARFSEIDRTALTVEQAVCSAPMGGRA